MAAYDVQGVDGPLRRDDRGRGGARRARVRRRLDQHRADPQVRGARGARARDRAHAVGRRPGLDRVPDPGPKRRRARDRTPARRGRLLGVRPQALATRDRGETTRDVAAQPRPAPADRRRAPPRRGDQPALPSPAAACTGSSPASPARSSPRSPTPGCCWSRSCADRAPAERTRSALGDLADAAHGEHELGLLGIAPTFWRRLEMCTSRPRRRRTPTARAPP